MKRIIFCALIPFISCASPENNTEKNINGLSFAKGFEIQNYSNYRQITVKNPWQKSQGEQISYILSPHPESLPDSMLSYTIIKTPVERVIVFSTTHIGYIAALGKSKTVVGVSGRDFVTDTTVRNSLENKECVDIGFAPNIDFESILLLHPDLVFLYGLDPSVIGLVKRLEEAGIKSVLVSEFLEGHPLGKAEWIRFFAAFYECSRVGDSICSEVEQNYLALRDSVQSIKMKPSVLAGLPWKDTWYMAGGKSFLARFIEDAGGNYLWKENSSTEFVPLDLESVFQKAVNADIWINTGSAESKSAIYSVDQRFQYVPAFKNEMLFNNNLRINDSGGNDFWESGAVRPDRVLSDLIRIFHPDKSGKQMFYYYKKLD
jgi:iron complex transport system substrate-binding protein